MPCVPLKLARHRQRLAALPSPAAGTATSTSSARTQRRSASEVDVLDVPERQPLFLPHQLDAAERAGCAAGLVDMESRLRDGQLVDSLDKLRVHLHIRSRLVRYKDRHVRHQKHNTRARAKIDQNERHINTFKEKYRAARVAKLALVGPGAWEQRWKPLQDSDVVTLRGDDEVVGVGTSEGKRSVSWIWMGADDGDAAGIRGLSDGTSHSPLKFHCR